MKLEERIFKRLNDLYWFKRTNDVVKYSPDGYNEQGVYCRDEWSSICDIGRTFSGVTLTEDDYLEVENNYINCAVDIMTQSGCKYLTIGYIQDYNHIGYKYKSRITKDQLATILRDMLRENIYCVLVNLKHKVMIDVGYDYYMHIFCPIDNLKLKILVESHNLYLNPRPQNYRIYI